MPSSKNGQTKLIILLVLSVVVCGICVSCIYWTRRFSKRRGEFGFAGRKLYISVPSLICCSIWLLTRWTNVWYETYEVSESKKTWLYWLAVWLHTTVTTLSFMTAAGLTCLRIWLIYFHVRLAVANEDNQWMSLITQPVSYFPQIVAISSLISPKEDLGAITEETHNTSMSEPRRSRHSTLLSFAGRRRLSVMPRSNRPFSVHAASSRRLFSFDENEEYSAEYSNSQSKSKSSKKENETDTEELDNALWFFDNKYTLGNFRWLVSRLLYYVVPILYPTLIVAGSIPGFQLVYYALFAAVLFFMLIFFVCIALVYPRYYNDSLRVRDEVYLLAVVTTVGGLCFSVALGVVYFGDNKFAADLAANGSLIAMGWLLVLIHTKWVIKNFPKEQKGTDIPAFIGARNVSLFSSILDLEHCKCCLTLSLKNEGRVTKSKTKNDATDIVELFNANAKDLRLKDVLADDGGFRYFMSHLWREFSYENLLCVIELVQFTQFVREETEALKECDEVKDGESTALAKHYIWREEKREDSRSLSHKIFGMAMSKLGGRKTEDSLSGVANDDGSGLRLPQSVTAVKSSIVYNRQLTKEQKLVVLVTKYIAPEAEMCVNVSYRTRQSLLNLSHFLTTGLKADEKAVYHVDATVFRRVLQELTKLMGDSMMRFRHTKEYATLKVEWNQTQADECREVITPKPSVATAFF